MSKFKAGEKICDGLINRRRAAVRSAYCSRNLKQYEILFNGLNEMSLHNAEVEQRAVKLDHFKKMCGGLDSRHAVHQQYTGHSEIMYTAWFCSDKVGGSFETEHDAMLALCRYEFERRARF